MALKGYVIIKEVWVYVHVDLVQLVQTVMSVYRDTGDSVWEAVDHVTAVLMVL